MERANFKIIIWKIAISLSAKTNVQNQDYFTMQSTQYLQSIHFASQINFNGIYFTGISLAHKQQGSA